MSKMWTKIFRSKSSKLKLRDEVDSSVCELSPGPHRSKFAKVVNTFTLKRHGRSGSVRKVNIEDFARLGDIGNVDSDNSPLKSSDYSEKVELPDEPVEIDLTFEPCPICTRTFAPKTLKKHVVICEKTVTKKRKIFDSSRQRREGTDLADFLPRNFGLPAVKQEPKASPTEKVMKQVTTPVLQRKINEPIKTAAPPAITPTLPQAASLPPKKTVSPTTNPSSILKEKPKPVLSRLVATAQPCPHCGRSFGTKAYDRHVEWCKEKTRLAPAQHIPPTNVAKERLQARTKYRAPCLKTKRGVNREKYSGLSCEDSTNSLSDGGSVGSACKSKDYPQEYRGNMDVSMTSSVMSSSMLSDGHHDSAESSFSKNNVHPDEEKYQDLNSYLTVTQSAVPTSKDFRTSSLHVNTDVENSKRTNSRNSFTLDSAEEFSTPQPKISKIPKKQPKKLEFEFELDQRSDKDEKLNQLPNIKPLIDICQPKTSQRNENNYLTEDDYETRNETKKIRKASAENTDTNEFQKKKYDTLQDNANNKPELVSLRDFIRQKKLDLANQTNSTASEVMSNPNLPAKTFSNNSLDCNKLLCSHTSLSEISSNDLTFSYEEEINSENEETKLNQNSKGSVISPSKSFTIRGFSDKYDPFLSAQRQLQELCSPTDTAPPTTSLPTTPHVKTSPETFMSKSFTGNTTVNKLNSVKSNFHRTLSLRVPRKTTPTRTIFPTSTKQKPTIQRGISDEGPISNNFLKPEEYDEMPVKSVCINDFATNRQTENHSTPKIIRRDPQSNRNRRNLKMNLMPTVGKKDINPLSKTDSLAIFLHYETATRVPDIPPSLTEKDLKDKSNNLSKQTSSKSSASDLDSIFTDKEKLCSLKNSLSNLLDSANSGVDSHLLREANPISVTKLQAIKLEPLPKILPKSERSDFNPFPVLSKDNDFIDPKLINVCDNLPINVTKLSDNELTSSSTESMEKTALQTESRFEVAERPEDSPLNQPVVHRNSTEKRNLLKRQLRLGKNQFLYDLSPDNDNYSGVCNAETGHVNTDSNKLESSTSTVDPVPDEFDIEEFISSFENAEEYPLFKDYKAFLSNRSLNKLSNNSRESSRSPMTSSRNQNDDDDHEIEKNEIFSSNESFLKHESEAVPYDTSCHAERDSPNRSVKLTDMNDNICERRRTISRSDNEDEDEREMNEPDINKNSIKEEKREEHVHFDSMNSNHDVLDNVKDLSKPSSLESLEIKKSVSSKQSADSAYGSLSRYSPVERMSRRTSALRSTLPDNCNESQLEKRSNIQLKRRSRDLSNDSSSSELSTSHNHHQDRDRILRTPDFGLKQEHRMSKFCHECGSKFVVPQAKFCMECGVKRIVLD